MADSSEVPFATRRLPHQCPLCDQLMSLIATQFQSGSKPIYIYRCAEHGTYHVSDTTTLIRGEPD